MTSDKAGTDEQIQALAKGADERRKVLGVPDDLTAVAERSGGPSPAALAHAARAYCHVACTPNVHDDACAWFGSNRPRPDRLPGLIAPARTPSPEETT